MRVSNVIVVWRGILGRCPKCGKGRLFKRYIAPRDSCSFCSEKLGEFKADDGPAWLTILLTGHLIAPFLLYVSKSDTLSEWDAIMLSMILTIVLAFILLPISKGIFIAVLWLLSQKE